MPSLPILSHALPPLADAVEDQVNDLSDAADKIREAAELAEKGELHPYVASDERIAATLSLIDGARHRVNALCDLHAGSAITSCSLLGDWEYQEERAGEAGHE